jgi:4-hydroxy-tetrahydrodipicolinate synthase
MSSGAFGGVVVPALTPFTPDLAPDTGRFIAHCKWLLDQGADGLAPFGTTSEANSMSMDERMELLEALVAGGVPAAKLMPGTGCCALTDSVRMTAHAVSQGCGAVLMLPPFYYKGMSDDGLYAGFSEVIQRVGDARLKIFLYHIPPQAQLGFSIDLIGRLVKEYPDTVIGLKDSSGDWSNTEAVIKNFPDFITFPGSEVFLLQGLRAGGAGCITATGNVNPAGIRKVFENWQTDQADALQARITEVRKTVQAYPMIPALKRMMAHFHGDPAWVTPRPPLMTLGDDKGAALVADLEAIDFAVAPR